jgi:hypothetical protein
LIGKFVNDLRKPHSLSCADPLQPEAPFLQAQQLDYLPGFLELFHRAMISEDVMTVSEVAA